MPPPGGNAPGNPPGAPPDSGQHWGPPPGGSGRPGPRRPARPVQPLRPPEPAIRQRAVAALILGVLSVLALLGVGSNFHRGIYLVFFALAVGIGACWLAVTAMRRARHSVSIRPRGAVAGMVLGVIGSLLSILLLIAFAAFWHQLTSFSQCLNEANTPSAQQACVSQLHRSVGVSKLSG
jgi:predicted PurR-regulated permease PerM